MTQINEAASKYREWSERKMDERERTKATFTFEIKSANYIKDLADTLEFPLCADYLNECLERYLKSELMVPVEVELVPQHLFDGCNVYCNVEYPQEPRLKPV